MNDIRVDRLEELKKSVIINDTDTIDYNRVLGIYDSLIKDTFSGRYDDIFKTKQLDGLDKDEKKKIFKLARKYKSLCLYGGNLVYWADSIEGVSLNDPDLVSMKVLDNFDFLLGLGREGEDVFKPLLQIQHTKFFEQKVVIDYLRNIFENDEVLKFNLKKLSKDYGKFSDNQIAMLCLFPEGVLYRVKDNKEIEDISSKELIDMIKIYLLGDANDDFHLEIKSLNEENFIDVIDNIYEDYQRGSVSHK